jgi:nucleotide-binding universal stress UspA family protein
MFKRILCATDGSANAGDALEVARSLAFADDATLTVVHVVERIVTDRGLAWYAGEEDVVSRVRRTEAELSAAGLDVSTKIIDRFGIQPATIIAGVAQSLDSDVIVVGTRGVSSHSGMLVGSVTPRLLHAAPCPVLAVPPRPVAPAPASLTEQDAAIYLG